MTRRILVACIGNVFLGDDGFGVEVARRLATRQLPDDVTVVDFGIRGLDLVYALLENHDAVIFVDTAARGGPPGTLYLIEPRIPEVGEVTIDAHGMDPEKVLGLAAALGARPTRTFVIGCEPERMLEEPDDSGQLFDLMPSVRSAVDEAVRMVESLIDDLVGVRGDVQLQQAT